MKERSHQTTGRKFESNLVELAEKMREYCKGTTSLARLCWSIGSFKVYTLRIGKDNDNEWKPTYGSPYGYYLSAVAVGRVEEKNTNGTGGGADS